MNDLEICRRIAEIEGEKETIIHPVKPRNLTAIWENKTIFNYNPLTDDALCFRLMVKYELEVRKSKSLWLVSSTELFSHFADKSPNRAICLAIIKANQCK